ncbi:MAG: hypothetical protein ACHQXK_07755 [Methanosarcina thermophila]|jgi:hypothetical protein|uniref:Uncharacterized protein n=1 Tax=Methanosarcina thermophila TaxID=2210 RepID=A0A1I7A4A2_METTE|nr:hypothetical protein [Methanosarcina thermophila]ALK05488.1 MAG: hypothetical protein AAY43_06945 [Methanosarcina sp. 795]NLU58294.1 hypothetical protein [Methanosarcina thermophila]SFT69717.1 hypothetical protein SAMN02910340_01851 [Methanosarcina thermophila]BAW29371.1 conserved hypothetical protein [Methanosarcina thermophila]GLI13584.1 hypothetical protein MTHERMMSTA1_07100 [Methanosarcina thermophila MST-A1]
MKKLTRKAWFHKRRIGWGVSPASLEGWLVTIAFIIIVPLVGMHYPEESIARYAILTAMVFIFIAIILLTGEAPGSEMWDKLKNK